MNAQTYSSFHKQFVQPQILESLDITFMAKLMLLSPDVRFQYLYESVKTQTFESLNDHPDSHEVTEEIALNLCVAIKDKVKAYLAREMH